jgi:dephospho-CoA kinase
MRIIQISGMGRVGKTTVAHAIAKIVFEMGYTPVIIPFAKGIKDEAASRGIDKDKTPDQYREFCQEIGAKKREEDPEYWVTQAFNEIENHMVREIKDKAAGKNYWERVIIQDDVRYMNELAFGRDLAATQLFICANGRKLREHDAEWRNHESEVLANILEKDFTSKRNEHMDLFDVVIDNGNSLEDLNTIIKEDIEEWLELGSLELESIDEIPEDYNP